MMFRQILQRSLKSTPIFTQSGSKTYPQTPVENLPIRSGDGGEK